jgi:SRSO17 transposase
MTPQQIASLGPALSQFLRTLYACFSECRLLDHFDDYCRGLLSDLDRKSVEPIALAAGCTVRALQLFLTKHVWDQLRVRDMLQQRIAQQHLPPPGQPRPPQDLGVIGLIDETSVVKKGTQTPGVQRQYCGAVGKIENCIVTVHLGVACGDFKALLDSDLFLPQKWSDDRNRCRAAGIPDELVYRPKTAIALDQVRHAMGNGIRFDWVVFDEGYGKDPGFLFGLDNLGAIWIGEVPKSFRCWPTPPQYHSQRREFASKQAKNVARWSPAFIYQDWKPLTITLETIQPAAWQVKAAQVHLVNKGYPTDRTYWLIVAWNQSTGEYKYFISNAPPATDLALLLRVAFRRAKVEHLFRLAKGEVGLSHYEGRRYVGLMRHMILSQTVLLFLAEQAQRLAVPPPAKVMPSPEPSETKPSETRGEKSAPHDGAVGRCPEPSLCAMA